MSSRQKKRTAAAAAVILTIALGIAGTFAASGSDESDGGFGEEVKTSLFLHDDFSKNWDGDVRNRDIYVENNGDSALYVRMRLDEFMQYGGKVLSGAGGTKENTEKWKPHIPDGKHISSCNTEVHDYFTIQLGNETGVKYKSGVKNAYDPAVPDAEKTKTTPAAKVVLIKDYLKAETKPAPCWVLDDADGYAYWHAQLKSETATGLLLNSITNTGFIDESYFYGINAKAEAVTEADLNAWFYGTTPTDGIKASDRASENAVKLLKNLSSKYIEITKEMEANGAKDYDSDNDGYLTKKENAQYEAENGATATPVPTPETGLAISTENFPDSALRSEIQKKDLDGDGKLSKEEIAAVTSLDLSGTGITDYTGLEYLTALTDLNVSNNGLTAIDFLNRTPKLRNLNCSHNQLAGLNLSKGVLAKILEAVAEDHMAAQLTAVDCSSNLLTGLTISSAPGLTTLNCSNNKLTKLDIGGNASLGNITATGQTTTVNVTYDKTAGKYKGGSGLFAAGTTFGADDAAYDSAAGGLTLDTLTEKKTSTYSLPLTYSGTQKGTLSGTITFSGTIYVPTVKDLVKAVEPGGTVQLANKDKSMTEWIVYNKTDSEADLITKDCVTSRVYCAGDSYMGWPASDIRIWLNDGTSGYKSQLSDEMKAAIKAQTLTTASAYSNWGGTLSSTDEIYLLTETASESGKVGKTIGASVTLTTEQLQCSSTAADGSSIGFWRLRSPHEYTEYTGGVHFYSGTVISANVNLAFGIRPALTVSLN